MRERETKRGKSLDWWMFLLVLLVFPFDGLMKHSFSPGIQHECSLMRNYQGVFQLWAETGDRLV